MRFDSLPKLFNGQILVTDETRQRILLSAGPIFAERGFAQATVRQVCDGAGVNHAALNYYFGSKEALYLEAINLAHTRLVQQVPPPLWDDETPPDEKLRRFILTILHRMLGKEGLSWEMRLLMRETIEPTSAAKAMVDNFIRPQHEILLGILRELSPSTVELSQLQKLAFSIIGQCLHYRSAGEFVALLVPPGDLEQSYDIDSLAEHITRFTLGGIALYHRPSESIRTLHPPARRTSSLKVNHS